MNQLRMIVLFGCLLSSLVNQSADAQQWTRFRGPNGSGVSEATTVPTSWTADDYNWQIKLPGSGHSSPVIWGNKLFVTSAEVDKGLRYLLCIDTSDGSVIWKQDFIFAKYKKHAGNTYATNSPVVDAERIYVLWQSQGGSSLNALTHDGKPVWQYDMGIYKSGHGTGSSPIVFEDLVIVGNDHDSDSFLIALNRTTGEVKWRVERLGDRACYSTPCVYQREGRSTEIIFTHSYRGITGIDARTGKKNWEIDVFGTHKQRAVGSPVIAGDLVIGSSGFTTSEKSVVAVRPSDTPSGSTVKEVYRVNRQVPHVPTPLVYKDRLFLWTDTGIVSCVEAASGRQIWQNRVGGNFHGSPVCVGGNLYAVDRDGVVIVIAASDKFKLHSRIELGETSRSTPAVSDGVMYLRTVSQLFSIGGKK